MTVIVSQEALRNALELVCKYGVARRDMPVYAQLITMRGHGNVLQLCGTDNGAIACAHVPILQADGDFRAGIWLIDAKKLMGSLQDTNAAVTLADNGAALDVTTDRQVPYANMGGSDEVAAIASVPADAATVATVDLDALADVARRAGAYRNPYLVIRTEAEGEALASLWDEQERLTGWARVGSGHEATFISVAPRYITSFTGGCARVAWKVMEDVPLWWFDTDGAVLTVAPMAPRFFEPWRRWRMSVSFPWRVDFQFAGRWEGYSITEVLGDQVRYLDALLQEAFPSAIEWYREQEFSRYWDTPEGVRLESADGQLVVQMVGDGNYPAIIHSRLWGVIWWPAWKMLYNWGVARYGHPCEL